MALSDYLTSDEWDACFYASFGQHASKNFGESMRKTIDALLKIEYVFEGLDSYGNKLQQVENGINAPKVCIWLGNPYNVNVLNCLTKGRNFLKQYLPSLVDETDEQWEIEIEQAKKEKSETKN